MNKKIFKNCSYITLCALFVYGFFYQKKHNSVEKEVHVVDYQDYKQITYIDSDGILIPVSCAIENCPTIQSEAYELFELMKNPDTLKMALESIIPSNTHLESVLLQGDILELHFNNLDAENELRFLEAISFVFNQLDGVNGIDLYVGNEKINQIPQGQIVFSSPLTKQLGINNFETGYKNIHQTKSVMVYYTKEVEGQEFYVPVSKRIHSKSTLNEQLETIISEISVSSTLNKASLFEGVALLEGSYLQDGHLYVNVNNLVLLDETTINSDVYDLLLLSFSKLEGVEKVSLLVDGEIMETRDTISVSNIVYNVVKI